MWTLPQFWNPIIVATCVNSAYILHFIHAHTHTNIRSSKSNLLFAKTNMWMLVFLTSNHTCILPMLKFFLWGVRDEGINTKKYIQWLQVSVNLVASRIYDIWRNLRWKISKSSSQVTLIGSVRHVVWRPSTITSVKRQAKR